MRAARAARVARAARAARAAGVARAARVARAERVRVEARARARAARAARVARAARAALTKGGKGGKGVLHYLFIGEFSILKITTTTHKGNPFFCPRANLSIFFFSVSFFVGCHGQIGLIFICQHGQINLPIHSISASIITTQNNFDSFQPPCCNIIPK